MSVCWKPAWCECEDCGPLTEPTLRATAYCYADCGGELRHWTRADGSRGFTCDKCGRTA